MDPRPNGLSLAGGGRGPLDLSEMVGHGVPGLPPWAFESAPFGAFEERFWWAFNSKAMGLGPALIHSR